MAISPVTKGGNRRCLCSSVVLRSTYDDEGARRGLRGNGGRAFRPLEVHAAALTGLERVAAPDR